jgi:transcriptional regulator with XRE-family HTH domain
MLTVTTDRWKRTDRATLGERIRVTRAARGWTQVDPATHLGVTTTTISRWERGWSLPHRRIIPTLSSTLGWPPVRLLAIPRVNRQRVGAESLAQRIGRALAEVAEAAEAVRNGR